MRVCDFVGKCPRMKVMNGWLMTNGDDEDGDDDKIKEEINYLTDTSRDRRGEKPRRRKMMNVKEISTERGPCEDREKMMLMVEAAKKRKALWEEF